MTFLLIWLVCGILVLILALWRESRGDVTVMDSTDFSAPIAAFTIIALFPLALVFIIEEWWRYRR